MLDRNNIVKKQQNFSQKCMLRNGSPYSFTFNFSDEYQFFGESKRDLRLDESVYQLYRILKKVATFELYPEFSTPQPFKCFNKLGVHSGPRFHLHGTIVFTNVHRFYLQTFNKLLEVGLWEIDILNDPEVFLNYCTKDREVMEDYVDSRKYQNATLTYPLCYPLMNINPEG